MCIVIVSYVKFILNFICTRNLTLRKVIKTIFYFIINRKSAIFLKIAIFSFELSTFFQALVI